jgi:hypothetical protein
MPFPPHLLVAIVPCNLGGALAQRLLRSALAHQGGRVCWGSYTMFQASSAPHLMRCEWCGAQTCTCTSGCDVLCVCPVVALGCADADRPNRCKLTVAPRAAARATWWPLGGAYASFGSTAPGVAWSQRVSNVCSHPEASAVCGMGRQSSQLLPIRATGITAIFSGSR